MTRFRLPRIESSDPERASAIHDAFMDRLVEQYVSARRSAGPQINGDGTDDHPEGDDPGPVAA